jgi:hypothetical protein
MGSVASADLLAYEGFDYPVGANLHNQSGGFGWKPGNNWVGVTTNDNTQIVAGSFTYDDGFGNTVVTTGNRVHSTGDATADGLPGVQNANSTQQPFRRLEFDNGAVGDSSTWLSFMALRTGQAANPPYTDDGGSVYAYGRAAGVQLFYNSNAASTTQGNELVSIGRATGNGEVNGLPPDTWGVVYRGSGAFVKASNDGFTTPTNANSTADFLLARIDHVGGVSNPRNDTISIWINPRLDNEALLGAPALVFAPTDPPTSGSDADRDLAFNVVRLFAGNHNTGVANNYGSIQVDEIKIGTDYNSVTLAAIPEPSSLALLGLGSLMIGRRSRRK